NRDRRLVDTALGAKQRLDAAERAAGDRDPSLVDVIQLLHVFEAGKLIVELLGLEQTHDRLRGLAPAARGVPLVENVAALRHLVAAPNGREDDIAMRHEDAGDGVELRTTAGVFLAAVVPHDRRKRSGAVRPEEKPGERQAVALERDALFGR